MTDNDIPWIHADALLIEASGLYLLVTEQEALELNRRTGGATPANYKNPAPPQDHGGLSPLCGSASSTTWRPPLP